MSLIVIVGYGLLGLVAVAVSVLAMVGIVALHGRVTRAATTGRRLTAPHA